MSLPPTQRLVPNGAVSARTMSDPRWNVSAGRKSRLDEEIARNEAVAYHSDPLYLLERVRQNSDGRLIVLDIDQCTALGEDTNDILRIIEALTEGFNKGCNRQGLQQIAKHLINPAMIE